MLGDDPLDRAPGSARTATAAAMARLAINAVAKNRTENRVDMRTPLAARGVLYAFNCRAIQSADLPRYL